MSDDMDKEQNKELKDFLEETLESLGYVTIPLEQIQVILDNMERQIMHEANIETQEELEFYLNKLEELVGIEEAKTFDIEQVIKWIKVLKSV